MSRQKDDGIILTYSMSLIQVEPGVFVVELPRKRILITRTNEATWKKIFTDSINEKAVNIPIKIVFTDKLKAYARFKAHNLLNEGGGSNDKIKKETCEKKEIN